MSSVRIEVEGSAALEPGGRVRGTVRWEDEGVDHTLLISLLWYTAGRGTEHVEVVSQTRVDAEAASGSAPFDIPTPSFPWSFSGRLITLQWAVEASLEPGGAVDRVLLTVAPDREEIRL